MHTVAAEEPLLAAQHLLARLFQFHDTKAFDQEILCFTEDCVWQRKGDALRGRMAILQVLRSRPASLVTMHLVTNVMVEPQGETAAGVAFFLTTYSHDDGQIPAGPIAPRHLPSVGIGRAAIRRDEGAWRIQKLDTDDWMFSAARAR